MLVNGLPSDCISADDRGLSYGDGVFRTLRLRKGRPHQWSLHFAKLHHDCLAMGLDCPAADLLLHELRQLSATRPAAVAKIIITRGRGERGYAKPASGKHTRIVAIQPEPEFSVNKYQDGIETAVCRIKLGHQPALAGIKHLNRLENVIAASECRDAGLTEGFLEDGQGRLIGGTRSNLFMVQNGALFTPDLAYCGVAGVQRQRVMAYAGERGLKCSVTNLSVADLQAADEIFLVNSVFGLWPVRKFPGYLRPEGPLSNRIRNYLEEDETRP